MRQPLTGHPRGFSNEGLDGFDAANSGQRIGSLRTFVVVLDGKDKRLLDLGMPPNKV